MMGPIHKIIPSTPREDKLKEELLSNILPWDQITVSLQNFPYYIQEHSKSLLVECVASNLKYNKVRMKREYGSRLKSSSHRIMLQTIPGTELYREALVNAVAREMKVPLLTVRPYLHQHHHCDIDDKPRYRFNKGDIVVYTGYNIGLVEVYNRTLRSGHLGEVYEVNGERVAVLFNICSLDITDNLKMEFLNVKKQILGKALHIWLDERDLRRDSDVRIHDCCILMNDLYKVLLQSQQPMMVYFPDSYLWPPSSKHYTDQYLRNVESMFDQFPEGVVMICAENNKSMQIPQPLLNYIQRLHDRPIYAEPQVHKLFTNVFCIKPPRDENLVNTFVEQLEKQRLREVSECNLKTMHKVHIRSMFSRHMLFCYRSIDIQDEILTREKAEKIIGWAMNHHLSSCALPCLNEETLSIPLDSIKLAISRLKMEENPNHFLRLKEEVNQKLSEDQPKNLQNLATDSHEERFVSAVVRSEDIDVKFDDVGALEHVKKILYETVILPMRRPELFSHGNLLKPCKGILLFGPPGTGKTLMAKALATESGANFINITAATITSMWVGETENLTSSLFSYARKLAPVIIFIDEVDSLLGARGHNKYDTSRLNEFMAAWDGLNSKEKQRLLVVGATNRPYDLDEAVIRRMPRRIYVGLPDVENRCKILKVVLNKENLESGFSFEQMAEATDGYSGSDLKNLCAAAAYRPLEEFLEQESKGEGEACDGVLRPLNINDFIHSKAKVKASVADNASSTMKLREWKEKYGEGEKSQPQNSIVA